MYNLQYKMFLLNKVTQTNKLLFFKFTIQNVSIKSLMEILQRKSTQDLQYKMFLLNIRNIQRI